MRKFIKLFKQSRVKKKRKRESFDFSFAPRLGRRIRQLLKECSLDYIDAKRIFCVESTGSKSRAYARMWGLPRIWQTALEISPAYILEVTHKFQKLSESEQDRVLLHELAHVPKNFSGALLGHYGMEKRIQEMAQKRTKRRKVV